jgi:hypothetical protein
MAEFLVKVKTYTHIDDEKDRRGVYKPGDIVDVRPDGHTWGNEERLPIFVVIKVPGLDPETVKDRMTSWHFRMKYDILNSVSATDTHTIKITGTDYHAATGEGKATRSKVETFLKNWNAKNIVESDNAVTFDISILDAISSRHFWDMNIEGLTFTETQYAAATGLLWESIHSEGKRSSFIANSKNGCICEPEPIPKNYSSRYYAE